MRGRCGRYSGEARTRRLLGLELHRLARRALPEGLPAAALAGALRPGVRHRRGQQHLLPAADARRSGRVGRAVAARVHVRGQVESLPDAHEAPDGHGSRRRTPARAPRAAARVPEDGPDALAAAGELPSRRRTPRQRARQPAARPPRLRVPPRELVLRRGARGAALAPRGAVHRRPPRAALADARRDRELQLRALPLRQAWPARQLQRDRARRVGARAEAAGPQGGGLRVLQQRLGGLRRAQCSGDAGARRRVTPARQRQGGRSDVLLILGIILLIIAIAGGVIVHPILFALAILAIVLFFTSRRGPVY